MELLSGIYRIVVNRGAIAPMFYIGQASCFQKRKQSHWSHLRCDTHKNKILQEAFRTYGESAFSFQILLVCHRDKETLVRYEQLLLEMQIRETGITSVYNLQLDCVTSLLGVKFSEEHRRRISEGQKGRTASEETRKRISASKKGKKSEKLIAHIKQVCIANRGKKMQEHVRLALLIGITGKKKSPEELAQRHASRKANAEARGYY